MRESSERSSAKTNTSSQESYALESPANMGLIIPTFTEKWHTTSYDAINPSRPELSAAGKSIVITGAGHCSRCRRASPDKA